MSRGRNNIFHFPKERVFIGDTFRCRKCRTYLFSFENLTIFHKKIEPVDQCSSWYLSCDDGDGEESLSWIKEAIDESNWTEGKLYCPKCSSRIGAFNITQGVKCSCFAFVIPAVWIQKCKVDQVILVDSKPNIRLPPENPTEPDSYHGNNNHHGIQTSQTSSQTGQTSNSDTGKKANESHTIQTRKTRYTYDEQTSQTGFSTISNASESFNSESEHYGSCTCLYTGQTSSKPANPEVDTKEHASIQDSSQALQLTGFEQEPNLSGLQSEDPESLQIWSNVLRSYKAFDVNQTQSIHSCQFILTNQSLRRRQNPSQDFEVCSESNSNVCGRSKTTQRHTENGDICDEDYSVSHVKSGSGEIQNLKKEEASEIPEHLICPICLDLLYEPLTSPCDHVFCDSCLRILNSKCRKSVPRCPLCRKSLNYVYPAVDLREEIRKTFSELYRKRHRAERRAPHRRLPLPSGRLKSRKKNTDKLQDVAMPYSVLVFLVCVLAVCVLCLVILFVFCPPSSNRCVTIIGYE